MKSFKIAAALVAATALGGIPAMAQSIVAPGPGQNGVPVIFWAHYMPQVPLSTMHNGTDVVPFVTQDGSGDRQSERTIEAALDSGINGFQMLCGAPEEYYTAAHNVRERTGKTMYIAPEWCDQDADPVKSANAIADFAIKHDADPCIAKVGGAQVHFFYSDVKWAQGDGLSKAREIFKQRGVKILFVPTTSCFDRQAMERTDLAHYQCWPAFQQPAPGKGEWLAGFPWEGATEFGTNWRTDVADALNDRLKSRASDFTFFPDIWPGYDSSNREFQAIHCPMQGVSPLRDGLRTWTGLGYKQMSFITWNDMNETLLMPSSRNVYGYSEIISYYHQIAENGQSPFDSPKFVVAYEPEALIGDQAYFQCELLPEHRTVSSDYIVTWRLEDQFGKTVATVGTRMTSGRENEDGLAEVRLDTMPFAGKTEVLVPYVTIRQQDISTADARVLYSNMRLAPVRLRYNNVRFHRPMVIALDRVASDENVSLAVKPATDRTALASPSVSGPSALKRLVLAESLMSAGSFRDNDTAKGLPPGKIRQYVRIELDAKTRCRLSIDGGTIEERYTPYWTMSLCRSVGPATTMDYDAQQQWGAPWNVFRLTGKPDAKISLTIDPKGTAQTVATTLGEVVAGNIRKSVTIAGKPVVVTFLATTGTTEANIDYPLPASGSYQRTLPLSSFGEAIRVYHAYALTVDGKIAFSNPVVLTGNSSAGKSIKVPAIETGGTFDDFVNCSAEESRNGYTPSDISTVTVSAGDVPYFRLAFDEGVGNLLNDAGIGHQFGAARIEGPFEWIDKGWRGSAVRLSPTSAIHVRSTSWPYGAATVSARVRVADGAPKNASSDLAIGPFRATVTGDRITVTQRFTSLTATGSAAIVPGWNHVAYVYDLACLRVYVNGKLVATSESRPPILQRTHWVPEIKIAPTGVHAGLLDGAIARVEVIGAPLDGRSVKAIYDSGQWVP